MKVTRMIAEARAALGADATWVRSGADRLSKAEAALDRAVDALAANGVTGSIER